MISPTGGVLAADSSAAALVAAIGRASTLDRADVRASVMRFDYRRMVTGYEQVLAGLVATSSRAPANRGGRLAS